MSGVFLYHVLSYSLEIEPLILTELEAPHLDEASWPVCSQHLPVSSL